MFRWIPEFDKKQRVQLCVLVGLPLLWVGLTCLVKVAGGTLATSWSTPVSVAGFLSFAGGAALLIAAIRAPRSGG